MDPFLVPILVAMDTPPRESRFENISLINAKLVQWFINFRYKVFRGLRFFNYITSSYP